MTNINKLEISKKTIIIAVIGLIVFALMPLIVRNTFSRHVMIMILVWSIIGMGWNFIGGYAGQVSMGHSLFYGIGGYASAIGFLYFNITPWIGMLIGVLISIIVAFLIGAPLLRLKGHYFAVATMAVGEAGRIIFINTKAIGGATGVDFLKPQVPMWYSMQFSGKLYYFYIFLAFAAVILGLVIYLDKSKFGYYLRTIKGNDLAAESVGINTSKYKLIAYILSASIVSIGGSLYAQYMLYIDPTMLMTLNTSLMICLVTVMGGVGKVFGPIVGSIILTLTSEYSRVFFGGSGNGMDQLLYGLMVIIVVLYIPDGILSIFSKEKLNRFIEKKSKKEVPSNEYDS
jgi:branched-chain amino acid transport system permease protein